VVVLAPSTETHGCGDAPPMAAEDSDLAPSLVAGEVAAILRRHRLAAIVPALVLGAGADTVVLVRHALGAEVAVGLALAIAFELYVGYAERIVAADRAGGRRPSVGTMLCHAATFTPALVAASALAVALPLAATGLLVLPGLWLFTRWSLFAPAIVHERLGPLAALARSAALVRGAAWPVAATATASALIEHAVVHATAQTAEPLLGSTLSALAVAALATAAVSPPAAFTISVVYERRLAASPT
jgi:hypothetical protein